MGLAALVLSGLAQAQWMPTTPSADSLPAFQADSLRDKPFRQVEAGPSPWAGGLAKKKPGLGNQNATSDDWKKRRPFAALYVGVSFMDFDGKAKFNNYLEAKRLQDSLSRTLQAFEPVHMAFPGGILAGWPVNAYLDVVAKTHSYWYKQSAVLGDSVSAREEEWYAVQANLGGIGLRYNVPPAFLSVSGRLGFYTQGIMYWNLGSSRVYSRYGTAWARYRPLGSGYEFQFGFQQAMSKPWFLTGSLGFVRQEFTSRLPWSAVIPVAAPAGNAAWSSSALAASVILQYNFGSSAIPAGTNRIYPTSSAIVPDSLKGAPALPKTWYGSPLTPSVSSPSKPPADSSASPKREEW